MHIEVKQFQCVWLHLHEAFYDDLSVSINAVVFDFDLTFRVTK